MARLMRAILLRLASLAFLFATGSPSVASSASMYDAPVIARVESHDFGAAEVNPTKFNDGLEESASPLIEGRRPSATPSARSVATNTADDAARFVVDSAGDTTLRAQGSNGWLNVSEHAAERMAQRGITIDALDSTLSQPSFQYWQPGANAGWRTGFYDPASKVFATTANGEVVTVINNASQTYINNVMSRVPPP